MIKNIKITPEYIECELEKVLEILNTKKSGREVEINEQIYTVLIKAPTLQNKIAIEKINKIILAASNVLIKEIMRSIPQESEIKNTPTEVSKSKTPDEIIKDFLKQLGIFAADKLYEICDVTWTEIVSKNIYTPDGITSDEHNNIDFLSSFKNPKERIALENAIKYGGGIHEYLVFSKDYFGSLTQIIYAQK